MAATAIALRKVSIAPSTGSGSAQAEDHLEAADGVARRW